MSPDVEVIWNGAMDPAFAKAHQRPAPPLVHQPAWYVADNVPARVVAHLRAEPEHTTQSVAKAFAVDRRMASVWLSRARRRGLIRVIRTEPFPAGGLVRIYAIVPGVAA